MLWLICQVTTHVETAKLYERWGGGIYWIFSDTPSTPSHEVVSVLI